MPKRVEREVRYSQFWKHYTRGAKMGMSGGSLGKTKGYCINLRQCIFDTNEYYKYKDQGGGARRHARFEKYN